MTAHPTRDQQEAELDYWMTRAYEAEKRAWQAEARIKAVRDVLADYAPDPDVSSPVPADPIRRALEGPR